MRQLTDLIQGMLEKHSNQYDIPTDRVPLASPTYGAEEILEAIECMTSSMVTMGKRVREFEIQFAEYIGAKHAIMVNSGSSANLLAASAMMSHRYSKRLKKGDEVIVPAVTWPTTIFPFAQLGLVPVVCDADPKTFNISVEAIEKAIGPRTKAVCIVPILGNPCDMDAIQALCRKHGLLLFEDTCESLGSTFGGKMCGTFGDVGTFSFFFSHHMTTMEGGMVITSDDELAESIRCQRAHGWTRNLADREAIEKAHSQLDPRFLFVDLGFNVRPMEIQAAFGKHQLRKLPAMNEVRRDIAAKIIEGLRPFSDYIQLPEEQPKGRHTWFGFPFLVRKGSGIDRRELMAFLEAGKIETRPITGGDLTQQPAFAHFEWRKSGDLATAGLIHTQGIYFGTHPGMNDGHVKHIVQRFAEFFRTKGLN